ncbi:hypothetical protein [Galbibacter mesophilus]|uniref:hypothetical protein n=1 Tax=Galbibacter mesophilus TaxID=379069 RepID=UPI00191E615F|nr:hypothetical protein [Galbibacter mesophilus]MCM5662487.1 hypothetical protein [Galbibacter mesophilus]
MKVNVNNAGIEENYHALFGTCISRILPNFNTSYSTLWADIGKESLQPITCDKITLSKTINQNPRHIHNQVYAYTEVPFMDKSFNNERST